MNSTRKDARQELASFLRARRGEVSPSQVGLLVGTRKVPGLRREEVAQRAGISVDYYTRLEQGRLPAPSGGVLDSLANALLLDPDQRDYLRRLADRAPARRRQPRRQTVPETVQALLSDLENTPAYVLGRFMDVLAWNDLAVELFTDFAQVPEVQRNFLHLTFLDPEARERLPDWDQSAGECVAYLRMDAGRYPNDPRLAALVAELSERSSEFHHWWTTHRVASGAFGVKHVRHPDVGDIRLSWQLLTIAQDPEQSLVVLIPADQESRRRLAALRGAASEHTTSDTP
ncbi:helix-turn-helix transcriptional regulator [Streptomyces sp. NBC_01619]|uniref:Helix-turn-helix transcriptional regulator n=1 Tax=Streptomyces pratisoli TaxID=3139917 RepID=A0ACC6QU56_9ACTN|nr:MULTISPECIES: helix-turn-helix transcriptional regulator [unclassified Streptomyces]MCX4515426.1 helix-turn-helix transcriptional regulator [Streptomyces sp. NBC_01619]